jgi:F-type H+-transporting ATPase subunit a
MTLTEKTSKWRWGVNRWIVLAFIIAGIYFAGQYPPISPYVSLPAEVVFHTGIHVFGQEVNITNTIIAMLLADVLLILIAFGVRRATRDENALPKGISGAVEGLLEALYNLTEGTAGKWTKAIFPLFATITLMVLVWNWTELIPGVDSFGIFNEHHIHDAEHCTFDEWPLGIVAVGGDPECAEGVIPFVRVASTDLNFTLALAVIAVVSVQVIGVRALGMKYFTKFWNVKTFFSVPIFGVIDFAVGLLETIGEFAKILSFSFRLFGNIFAGSILLFVIGSLVPVVAQSAFLMLEFFVGLIQAIVFGMLTMVFMAQATISHDHGDEEH